jgi:hypothetical protein
LSKNAPRSDSGDWLSSDAAAMDGVATSHVAAKIHPPTANTIRRQKLMMAPIRIVELVINDAAESRGYSE